MKYRKVAFNRLCKRGMYFTPVAKQVYPENSVLTIISTNMLLSQLTEKLNETVRRVSQESIGIWGNT